MQTQTHREQAKHIRAKLAEEVQTLKLLEEDLKGQPGQRRREWERLNEMSAAIGYLQKALAQLDKVIAE
jgi:hypothetical protein